MCMPLTCCTAGRGSGRFRCRYWGRRRFWPWTWTANVAPASLVKMMTAAVALDRMAPSTPMTVPDGAPSVGAAIGGTAMGLIPGERLSLHDLLYGMLLPSGNDAAYTIAAAIAGTQDNFADLMNRKAAGLGLTRTHFVQAYGLDAPGEYSTARDLLHLAIYDLQHYALFRDIVKTTDHVIGQGLTHRAYALHNRNSLLGVYPGAFGVKTGTTPQAGQNLVAVVQRDGHRVIAAILGAADRYADATAVLNYAVAVDVQQAPAKASRAA
jgi:D-alanyl-D-alanine carboxypeptidase (penicillin-binding protein 5/6)